MHIKMIHDMVEKLAKCADMEIEKGIEKIDAEEMSKVTDMIKDLAEAEYYSKISKAMDEAEYGEDYDYRGAYDEHERKGYRGQRRDSRGRYISRRGYESYMMPDMDWDDMEYQRDIDRPYGRMGYASGGSSMGSSQGQSSGGSSSSGMSDGSQGGSRGYSESRYDRARRGYEETKSMHNSGSAEDKQITMKEAEKMINVIFDELEESLSDAPKEVKDMIKNKGMAKLQKMN
jgi:hypothetical protein